MNKNGIEFGSHTVNHPILTNISLDDAKWEIENSKNCIEENIGQKLNHLHILMVIIIKEYHLWWKILDLLLLFQYIPCDL